ncbi:hypothetical protein PR001_g9878 [Phytophthora rubi]|uniref:Uncharacterized protein n=1 Tax=Phytophthora rubi TaxID=129364 RepID=A0A6A3MR61_9STRA|nr:hypothetical protein PR001_g9878 [Phytophthora rubi]
MEGPNEKCKLNNQHVPASPAGDLQRPTLQQHGGGAVDGEALSDAAVRAVEAPVRGEPAQWKISFVMRPRFYRRCVTTLELTDNFWTHTMDISGYAVREVDSGRVLFTRAVAA